MKVVIEVSFLEFSLIDHNLGRTVAGARTLACQRRPPHASGHLGRAPVDRGIIRASILKTGLRMTIEAMDDTAAPAPGRTTAYPRVHRVLRSLAASGPSVCGLRGAKRPCAKIAV